MCSLDWDVQIACEEERLKNFSMKQTNKKNTGLILDSSIFSKSVISYYLLLLVISGWNKRGRWAEFSCCMKNESWGSNLIFNMFLIIFQGKVDLICLLRKCQIQTTDACSRVISEYQMIIAINRNSFVFEVH